MVLTDAIVYRQIAGELGRLPPELIKSVVMFYTLALDMGRLADGASTAQAAYESILGLAPRLKMNAAILLLRLDKFEGAGFRADADTRMNTDEFRKLAMDSGYPADQVLKDYGLQEHGRNGA
jgi:hypothetical protein